ncbi:hypothetical protein BRD00_01740 [Halobacteriales archaeon QS_8_69_26]|nr:MAG: hypothetical protein BRD00_01740 [Halobacteriales archaeon QS_8_69_26]
MNGNTPYAGLPGITRAGKRASADVPDLTPEQKRALREEVTEIAALTREYLPDEYVVNSNVSQGATGPQARVAVRPPVGQPVSADFAPDLDTLDDPDRSPIGDDDPSDVARGLAANAAFQVKLSVQDQITPTAR